MLEFLTESDVPDSVKDVVDVIGIDAFKGLVKLVGGSNLYIWLNLWGGIVCWSF